MRSAWLGKRGFGITVSVALVVLMAATPVRLAWADQSGSGDTDVCVQMLADREEPAELDNRLPESGHPEAMSSKAAASPSAAPEPKDSGLLPKTGDEAGLVVALLVACSAFGFIAVGTLVILRRRS